MVLDIITGILIVVPMGIGMARGFAYIIVRFLGWISALAAGYFLAPTLRAMLEGGPIGRWIHFTLMKRFIGADGLFGSGGTSGIGSGADVASDPASGLPGILGNTLQDSIDQTVENAMELMVNAIEQLILAVISFLLIVVMVRLVLILVIRPLSKMRGKNPVSLFNKVMGLVLGSIEGLLLAFLFLAALVPVMQMGSPETAQAIANGLKESYLAGALYEGNLLLLVFR